MASLYELEVITPDREFYKDQVEMVIVRSTEGDMGIMKGHLDYVVPLDIGVLKIKKDGIFKEAALSGGFVKIGKEKVTILTDAAEWPHEIDVKRAQRAKDEAQRETKEKDEVKALIAEIRLKKAINRLNVADSKSNE